jgi:hypothetical protein
MGTRMINFFIQLFVLIFTVFECCGIYPINFFYPDDHPFKLQRQDDRDWQFSIYGESSLKVNGRDSCSNKTNVLQIYNENQDALAMIRGFAPDSEIGKFSQKFNNIADDLVRGHICLNADASYKAIFPIFRYYAPCNFTISVTVPFYWAHLKNITCCDLTENKTFGDMLVQADIVDNLDLLINNLGEGLTISNWKKSGLGDIWLVVDWIKSYYQPRREVLKEVLLNLRAGLTLPTGRTQDIDQILSMPFGNDRSLGVIFGGEIQVTMWDLFILGVDAEYWHVFSANRCYRIKTDINQTEFLLLAKTSARKDWGLTQRYDIWGELLVGCGFSLELWYQYFKHNADKYSFCESDYVESIANSAYSLKDWTAHNLIFLAKYNGAEKYVDADVVPQFVVFYRMPVNGYRSIQASTIGVSLALEF